MEELLETQDNKPQIEIDTEQIGNDLIGNTKTILTNIKKEMPGVDCSANVSLGSRIEPCKLNSIPIGSIDVPPLGYPKEFINKLIDNPLGIVNHLRNELNSSVGLTKSIAERKRLTDLTKIANLNTQPIFRVPLELDKETGKLNTEFISTLCKLHSNGLVSISFNPAHMSIYEYLRIVKEISSKHINTGISLDPGLIFKHFGVREGLHPQVALEATRNLYSNLLNENAIPIVSLDISNYKSSITGYNQPKTDIFTPGGMLPIRKILQEYRSVISKKNTKGRTLFELTTNDINLLISSGNSYTLSQFKSFF